MSGALDTAKRIVATAAEHFEEECPVHSFGRMPFRMKDAPVFRLLLESIALAVAIELDHRGIGRLEAP